MTEHVCDPEHPDCAAYLHYADPANREPAAYDETDLTPGEARQMWEDADEDSGRG